MARVQVVVVDESGSPRKGVTVAAYSLANFPNILARKTTDRSGKADFDVSGPAFFDAFDRRGVSFRDRSYQGKIQIQITSFGTNMNAEYVVDSNGFGTHTTLFGPTGALMDAVVSNGSKFIWVCSTHQETVTAQTNLGTPASGVSIIVASGSVPGSFIFNISGGPTSALFVGGGYSIFKFSNLNFYAGSPAVLDFLSSDAVTTMPFLYLTNCTFDGGGGMGWGTVYDGTGSSLGGLIVRGGSYNIVAFASVDNSSAGMASSDAMDKPYGKFSIEGVDASVINLITRFGAASINGFSDFRVIGNSIYVGGTALDFRTTDLGIVERFRLVFSNNNIIHEADLPFINYSPPLTGNGRVSITGNVYVLRLNGGVNTKFFYASGTTVDNVVITGNSLRGQGIVGSTAIQINGGAAVNSVFAPNSFAGWGTNIGGTGAMTTFSGPITFSGATTFGPLPSGIAHSILSATHSDSLVAAAVRGGLIVGNSTPKWSLLAVGAAGSLLWADGTDTAWTTSPRAAGYLRVGSSAAPSNTTAGDINSLRLFVGADAALLSGLTGQVAGHFGISAQNELRLYNAANSFYVGFKAGSPAANKIWTLPAADGTAGQVLQTDGAGNLSFAAGGGGGAVVSFARPMLLTARGIM